MNPRVFRIYRDDQVAPVIQDLTWRLKVAGPVEILVSKIGELDTFGLWERRYRKLIALISENVAVEGRKYPPRAWDAQLKAQFLIPEEIELPGGKVYSRAPSTKRMTADARDDYLVQVREYAAEHGIFLQRPEWEG